MIQLIQNTDLLTDQDCSGNYMLVRLRHVANLKYPFIWIHDYNHCMYHLPLCIFPRLRPVIRAEIGILNTLFDCSVCPDHVLSFML